MQGWCSKWHHWHIYSTTTKKYQEDIFGVEQRSGSRLPGVECGASFSDMSAGTQYFLSLFSYFYCLSWSCTLFSDFSFRLFSSFLLLNRFRKTCWLLGGDSGDLRTTKSEKMKINQFFDKSISWSVFSFPTDLEIQESLFFLWQPFVGSGNLSPWYL